MRCICELINVGNIMSGLLAWQSVAYVGLGVKGAAHSPQCGHSLLYVCLQFTGQRDQFAFQDLTERQSCKGSGDRFA